jgi:hypothetical protein
MHLLCKETGALSLLYSKKEYLCTLPVTLDSVNSGFVNIFLRFCWSFTEYYLKVLYTSFLGLKCRAELLFID